VRVGSGTDEHVHANVTVQLSRWQLMAGRECVEQSDVAVVS